mmetsp:Transcript_41887/g.127012  ORF Transcript_41887/g.127012 Transcript_41887/m.127012 type:complete len:257 (-) Transcript_41887:541-1311(-)
MEGEDRRVVLPGDRLLRDRPRDRGRGGVLPRSLHELASTWNVAANRSYDEAIVSARRRGLPVPRIKAVRRIAVLLQHKTFAATSAQDRHARPPEPRIFWHRRRRGHGEGTAPRSRVPSPPSDGPGVRASPFSPVAHRPSLAAGAVSDRGIVRLPRRAGSVRGVSVARAEVVGGFGGRPEHAGPAASRDSGRSIRRLPGPRPECGGTGSGLRRGVDGLPPRARRAASSSPRRAIHYQRFGARSAAERAGRREDTFAC